MSEEHCRPGWQLIAVSSIIAMALQQPVAADIVWDQSPATTNAHQADEAFLANDISGQNWVERFNVSWPTFLTGMDMYTGDAPGIGMPGATRVIRIYTGNKSFPGIDVADFLEVIAVVDTDGIGSVSGITRKHVDFTVPVLIEPFRDYWIGMAGIGAEVGLAMELRINPPDDGKMGRFDGYYGGGGHPFGDMAFRLHGEIIDTDGDGISDDGDNCLLIANAAQRDTDADGIGNRCDPDLNNDCGVNFADLMLMRERIFTPDETADFDGDGIVNFADLAIMRDYFFGRPGASSIPNACDVAPIAAVLPVADPAAGSVPVLASLSDDYGITLALLRIDGIEVARLTAPPWEFAWNTLDLLDGEYAVTVAAVDSAGNLTESAPLLVNVANGIQLLADQSPASNNGYGVGFYPNEPDFTNYADSVFFGTNIVLTQVDIYSTATASRPGRPVVIRVWADDDGVPGSLLHERHELVSEIDLEGIGDQDLNTRKEAILTEPIPLSAGTYWIGMNGHGEPGEPGSPQLDIFLYQEFSPADGQVAEFFGTQFIRLDNTGDMAFRLVGSSSQ